MVGQGGSQGGAGVYSHTTHARPHLCLHVCMCMHMQGACLVNELMITYQAWLTGVCLTRPLPVCVRA